jgi:hypothetical protein
MSISTIEQSNLYIKKDKYNVDYNFYNYNKFKIQKNIPITYRSPTLFLDGLYFELPQTRVLSISKLANSMTYELLIRINKSNSIYNIFENINNYNKVFFSENREKFILKVTKSNKRTFYRNEETYFVPPIKNPLIKQYNYVPFYKIVNNTDNTFEMSVMIKHNYLIKIIELILLSESSKSDVNTEYYKRIKSLYELLIETEYFTLKDMKINYSLFDIDLLIKFWIKSTNFIGDEKKEQINMLWYICDYNF